MGPKKRKNQLSSFGSFISISIGVVAPSSSSGSGPLDPSGGGWLPRSLPSLLWLLSLSPLLPDWTRKDEVMSSCEGAGAKRGRVEDPTTAEGSTVLVVEAASSSPSSLGTLDLRDRLTRRGRSWGYTFILVRHE